MRAYFSDFQANCGSDQKMKLKDCSSMQYGFTETASSQPVGPKFLRITDVAQSYIDWSGVPYCPISAENHEKYVLHEGDVVVARTGATVGYSKMLGCKIPDAVFASFLVRITPTIADYKYYMGLEITSPKFLEYVQNNAGGSAQPQANPPLLGEYELVLPDASLMDNFNDTVKPFLNAMELNEIEITHLNNIKEALIEMISSR